MYFFLKCLEDISSFRGATEPLFWTSGNVCPGFQCQGGYVLFVTVPLKFPCV